MNFVHKMLVVYIMMFLYSVFMTLIQLTYLIINALAHTQHAYMIASANNGSIKKLQKLTLNFTSRKIQWIYRSRTIYIHLFWWHWTNYIHTCSIPIRTQKQFYFVEQWSVSFPCDVCGVTIVSFAGQQGILMILDNGCTFFYHAKQSHDTNKKLHKCFKISVDNIMIHIGNRDSNVNVWIGITLCGSTGYYWTAAVIFEIQARVGILFAGEAFGQIGCW